MVIFLYFLMIPLIAFSDHGVMLSTTASTLNPFKNETVLYTVKLMSDHNINNISLENLALENAMVKLAEKPKIETQIIEGVKKYVVEFRYLITPLKPGVLEIPPLAVQGEIPIKSKGHRDFFSMIQGFDHVKPFILQTDEIRFKVAPPVEGIDPWLAAESIAIKEALNPSSLYAFEPVSRNFEILGEGILSLQLPDLSAFQADGMFRVYSDTPELIDRFQGGKIQSVRKESYTLIPQAEGELTLPGVSFEWWDVKNNRKAVAAIAPQIVHVLPSRMTSHEPIKTAPEELKSEIGFSPVFYVLIGALAALLVIALISVFFLRKQIKQLGFFQNLLCQKKFASLAGKRIFERRQLKKSEPKPPKKEKLPDLNPT